MSADEIPERAASRIGGRNAFARLDGRFRGRIHTSMFARLVPVPKPGLSQEPSMPRRTAMTDGTRSHETLVTRQYGSRADAYLTSAVHAEGEDLRRLEAIAAQARPAKA